MRVFLTTPFDSLLMLLFYQWLTQVLFFIRTAFPRVHNRFWFLKTDLAVPANSLPLWMVIIRNTVDHWALYCARIRCNPSATASVVRVVISIMFRIRIIRPPNVRRTSELSKHPNTISIFPWPNSHRLQFSENVFRYLHRIIGDFFVYGQPLSSFLHAMANQYSVLTTVPDRYSDTALWCKQFHRRLRPALPNRIKNPVPFCNLASVVWHNRWTSVL